jgi:hypothetical protein
MSLRGFLGSITRTRGTLRSLAAIAVSLGSIADSLKRLADQAAPQHADAPSTTSVDYLNVQEAIAVQAFAAQVQKDLGREPTEDEILRHLAYAATQDFHTEENAAADR